MSKSDKSKKACINLIDDPEMIRIKISKAKTDSLGRVSTINIIDQLLYRLSMILQDLNFVIY
jgi:tryptophanyl-tRNA synthetase